MYRLKKRLLLFGNYGGQNWGDEAILDGLLDILPPTKYDITVVSADPGRTHDHHRVAAVSPPPFGFRSLISGKWLSFFKILPSVDLVIFGGGGLVQDREPQAIFLWWFYVRICRGFGKRTIFVGNSVGPLSSKRSRRLAADVFRKAPYISVRDSSSEKLLRQLEIQSTNIVQSTDAVFLRRPIWSRKKSGTLLLLRGDGNMDPDRIKKLYSILPKPVRLIAMDKVDREFASSLDVPVIEPESVDDLRRTIAGSRLVLSSRLHGGILALHQKTPFIVFAAAPKVRDFFTDRGLADVVFSERFQMPALSKRLRQMLNGDKQWRDLLRKKQIIEQKKAKKILPHFLQKL